MLRVFALCLAIALIPVVPAPALAQDDAQPEVDCSEGGITTYEMNVCAGRDLDAAKAEMARYLAAARERFLNIVNSEYSRDTEAGKAKAIADFDTAQALWEKYRTKHCGSVYYQWRDGSIRGVMGLTCHTGMVKKRTWQLWSDWLTSMDSSPPKLPEPDFGYYPGRDYSNQ